MDSGLGGRIRKLRLERKMTQREVVGDFITRNMLSQIESGQVNPSINTLRGIAQVLKTPLYTLNNDFRIKLDPKREEAEQQSLLHEDENLIAENFGYEILTCYGLDADSYASTKNDNITTKNDNLISALIGFGIGVFVCLVPTAIVFAVRKKKKHV